MYVLGSLYLETNDLLSAAGPVVKAVNNLCRETVSLGIYQNGYRVLVLREENLHGFRWQRHVGSSQPAYASAIGLAILSELPDEEIDRVYPDDSLSPLTSMTVRTKTELRQQLSEIRKAGMSTGQGGSEGIEGIGVAIRSRNGEVAAGISIAVPVFRLDDSYRSRLVDLATRAADLISYRLGYVSGNASIRDVEELSEWWTGTLVTASADTTEARES
jgi:DNA-binding IclR family transcriptional regulator